MKEEGKGGEKKESIEERQREREDERGKKRKRGKRVRRRKKKPIRSPGGIRGSPKRRRDDEQKGPLGGGDEAPLSGQNSIASEATIRIDWVELGEFGTVHTHTHTH